MSAKKAKKKPVKKAPRKSAAKKKAVKKTPVKKKSASKAKAPKKAAPKTERPKALPLASSGVQLRVGQMAPSFSLMADQGETLTLEQFRGKKLVLYFYPKDDTPGCTRQACDFRDSLGRLQSQGVVVLGVSKDTVALHQKFKQKYGLNFPLLADPTAGVLQAYGVWKEKMNYGRAYMGIERTTFLIDAEGKIRKIYPKVKVEGHVAQVLSDLSSI